MNRLTLFRAAGPFLFGLLAISLPGRGRESSYKLSPQIMAESTTSKIVEEIAQFVEDRYIFPNVGVEIAKHLRARHRDKAYSSLPSLGALARELTKDMRAISNDAHLGVVERRGGLKQGIPVEDLGKEILLTRGSFQNYGFKSTARLLGNVGCVVVDELSHVDFDGNNFGGETAKSALQFVSNCRAFILDLRDNFGGREEMALLILSRLFSKPIHILTNSYRGQEPREVWTPAAAPMGRLAEIPIYVLTSRHTVSGGEMLAFVLKNQNRATIIGEKTRGAAHRTHLFSINSAKLDVAVPVGTTIDPVSGHDWEGIGVEPDIRAPSGRAMDIAYGEALRFLAGSLESAEERQEVNWALMDVEARLHPVSVDQSSLIEYTSEYQDRRITLEEGHLTYQRKDQPGQRLTAMARDLFSFSDPGMFYVRIRFERDETGAVIALVLLYDTGQKERLEKKKQ